MLTIKISYLKHWFVLLGYLIICLRKEFSIEFIFRKMNDKLTNFAELIHVAMLSINPISAERLFLEYFATFPGCAYTPKIITYLKHTNFRVYKFSRLAKFAKLNIMFAQIHEN